MSIVRAAPLLDARLALAASFIRMGERICDVGTDHAYLPISLILRGISPYAVATDVHAPPLDRARRNAEKWGCADRMVFILADGVSSLDLASRGVRVLLICGMGGELIARILDEAPYTRTDPVRAVLQPMSSAIDLRIYLARAGYRIIDERLAASVGRIYTCMSVVYDGVSRVLSPAALLLGESHIRRGAQEPLFMPYLQREIDAVRRRREGLRRGGADTAADDALLAELGRIAEAQPNV
jgi:tRNA (adenine22-N1)-methyltransferase